MAIQPITGMLRKGLVLNISTAFGRFIRLPSCRIVCIPFSDAGLGTTFGYLWWYENDIVGYHLPRVRARDHLYATLEAERAKEAAL
ncbi:Cytochrome c oxidase subunit 7A [Ophidiomyces ophidiicola]|nr:Cytochrome c oxidase subunit 7A [Ophidiomyces ophidiicola]